MYLVISIVLSIILGYVLMFFGPLFGGLLAFGIIAGCLFRGLYLLNEIHKKVMEASPKKDKVKKTLDNYIAQREEKERRA